MTTKTPPPSDEDDPFAEFAHWRKENWPVSEPNQETLTEEQRAIVEKNVEWLIDAATWKSKADRFEEAVNAIENEDERKSKRQEFGIRFDMHDFADQDLYCYNFVFPCPTSFYRTRFSGGHTSFAGAKFLGGHTRFTGAEFTGGDVDFREAEFIHGNTDFVGAKFSGGRTDFAEAKVSDGDAYFMGAEFSGTFFARNMVVTGDLYFNAIFHGYCSPHGLRVDGSANFSDSTFRYVPDLRDAKLDRPPEVAKMGVPEPEMTRWIWNWLPFKVVDTDEDVENGYWSRADDVARYRKLKTMALAANDHEKDGEFFHYEMLAKRGTETTTFFGLLFNSLYWHLSDFGQSFIKPFKWLGITLAIFTLLYIITIEATTNLSGLADHCKTAWFSIVLSIINGIPLLGTLFRLSARPDGQQGWFLDTYAWLIERGGPDDSLVWIGVAQSTIGLVLLFLLALALRNRFRLK